MKTKVKVYHLSESLWNNLFDFLYISEQLTIPFDVVKLSNTRCLKYVSFWAFLLRIMEEWNVSNSYFTLSILFAINYSRAFFVTDKHRWASLLSSSKSETWSWEKYVSFVDWLFMSPLYIWFAFVVSICLSWSCSFEAEYNGLLFWDWEASFSYMELSQTLSSFRVWLPPKLFSGLRIGREYLWVRLFDGKESV